MLRGSFQCVLCAERPSDPATFDVIQKDEYHESYIPECQVPLRAYANDKSKSNEEVLVFVFFVRAGCQTHMVTLSTLHQLPHIGQRGGRVCVLCLPSLRRDSLCSVVFLYSFLYSSVSASERESAQTDTA